MAQDIKEKLIIDKINASMEEGLSLEVLHHMLQEMVEVEEMDIVVVAVLVEAVAWQVQAVVLVLEVDSVLEVEVDSVLVEVLEVIQQE